MSGRRVNVVVIKPVDWKFLYTGKRRYHLIVSEEFLPHLRQLWTRYASNAAFRWCSVVRRVSSGDLCTSIPVELSGLIVRFSDWPFTF